MLALRLTGLGAGRFDCGVNDYGVPLGRDDFLRGDDLAADRAVLALRLTGLGAGRLDCGVNDHGVSLGRDHSLRNDDLVADGAVLALRLTGLGAGGPDCGVNDHGVPLSRDHFLRNDDLAADGAVLALRLTGLGAGRLDCRVNDHGVPLGRDFFQAGKDRTANRALRAGLMAGLGAGGRFFGDLNRRVAGRADGLCFCLIAARAGKRLDTGVFTSRSGRDHTIVPSVAKRGNDLAVCDLFVTILAVGVASIAGRGAGGILRAAKLLTLMRARLSAPCASDIVDGIAGLSLCSLKVGAVSVVQLCGCDGDVVLGRAAVVLIRLGLLTGSALLAVDAGTLAGADIRTALRGVDAADGGQRTVDVHLHIRQRRTLTCPSGGIDHWDELLAITAAVAAPLVHIVNVDALAAGHHQLGVLGDGYLHAGQQRRRLVDGQLAALCQIDGHVVGQRQNIVRRADFYASQGQVQAVDLRHTVDGIVDTVSGAVIRLGQTAGGQLEHSLVADKGDGGGLDAAHGIHAGIYGLAGAGVQGQRHLHILHGILVKGEHLTSHLACFRAAPEVQDLVPLIDGAAGLYSDRAAAGDEAPCVQACAGLHVDGAAGLHFDVAIGPDDAALSVTGGCKVLAADADGAIDGKRGALAHGQRPEYLGARLGGGGRRGTGIAGLGLVKGDQQGDASGNGVAPRDRAAADQCYGGGQLLLRLRDRVVQVVKALTAGLKERRVIADKPRRDGAVVFNVQCRLGRGIDVLSLSHIVPAHELIARRRGRYYLIGSHGALRVGVGLGDGLAVHGIGAIFGGLEGHGGAHIGHQRHVGHGDLGGGAGAAGLDVYLDAGVGSKLLGELAARRDRSPVYLNGAAVQRNGIVEGQRRLCGSRVGDGQCGVIMCVAAGSACAGGRTDDLGAGGGPRVVRVAGEAQADALVSQPDNGAAVCRIRRHGVVGKQHEHHAHTQHKGKEAPIHIFHFLPTFFPFFTL